MEQQNRFFSKESGAKKGLEQKLKFWSQDKKKTEFNIAVAQALNLAVQTLTSKQRDFTDEEIEIETKKHFNMLMKYRNDNYFRNVFIETSLEDEKVADNEVKLDYGN